MIQRVQSLYLLLSAIASLTLALSVSNAWLGLQLEGRAAIVVFAESVLSTF
jgi:hypothetical protein